MSIAFAQVKYLSRSKALQATAAAAYRSCSKIYDERTGMTFDYTHKTSPLLYSEIILPENSDEKFKDREFLWNTVEKMETRSNSQVAKEVVLALPKDEAITDENKIELARRFALTHFVNKGVAVDINIHNEEGNPHAHILITTRRLLGDQFDSHKARDLDPKVIRGRVQVDRLWGEEWRHFQNHFFLAKGLDLSVDANGMLSQVHLGKHVFHSKDRETLDLWQANQARQEEAKLISLNHPESVLNQLTLHHAVFSEHDIARLLHKHIDDQQEFQATLIAVKSSKQIISLGQGEDGKERYTTRAIFELENNIQYTAEQLKKCHSHSVPKSLSQKIINHYQLNDEQANAIRHISHSSDIAIIVGRAGTGKTYALKAAKDIFTQAGYHVQGIALSGIAAHGLQEASGIPSRTITSFIHSVRKGTLKLTQQDIVIMDEAGMADLYALGEITEVINKAQAKLVLVGDEEQLQPIGPGAPFRALLEPVGFAELQHIIRQEEEWQRTATHHLATGNVKEALKAYQEQQHIHFNKTMKESMHRLVEDWHTKYTQENLELHKTLIMAHRNADVMQLNQIARAKRIITGEIDHGVLIKKDQQEFWLSVQDRLVFLRNDSRLDVKNGQFGTVTKIEMDSSGDAKKIFVTLDNKKLITFDPFEYQDFVHGYSATVHKTQGLTVDHSFIYINGKYWNRNLMYVAGSRHKKTMNIYADQQTYSSFEAFGKAIDKEGLKDSLLDYPLNFAKRRGIDIEGLFEKLKEYTIERLKTAKIYLHEKYHQFLTNQKKIATQIDNQPAKFNHKENGVQHSDLLDQTKHVDEVKNAQEKFYKLIDDLTQAKTIKNHYAIYKIKRQLEFEAKKVHIDKKLFQAIQTRMPELANIIGKYHCKQMELEVH